MKLTEIKTIIENRLLTLDGQKNNAITLGDMEAVNRISIEIEETTQTVNQLG